VVDVYCSQVLMAGGYSASGCSVTDVFLHEVLDCEVQRTGIAKTQILSMRLFTRYFFYAFIEPF
jgi:hypothetical protein